MASGVDQVRDDLAYLAGVLSPPQIGAATMSRSMCSPMNAQYLFRSAATRLRLITWGCHLPAAEGQLLGRRPARWP